MDDRLAEVPRTAHDLPICKSGSSPGLATWTLCEDGFLQRNSYISSRLCCIGCVGIQATMPVLSPAESELFIRRLVAATMQAQALMQLDVVSGALCLSLRCVQANMLYFTHAAYCLHIEMLACCPVHAGTCTQATGALT